MTIEVSTPHVASVQALSDKLRVYNAAVTVQYYQESGEMARASGSATLRDELIHSVKSAPNTFQFHVPLNREALSAFNHAARQCLAFCAPR